jgi:hypothetical protein
MIGGTLYSAGTGSRLWRIAQQAKLGCLEKLDRALILSESATQNLSAHFVGRIRPVLEQVSSRGAFIGSSEQKSCGISATL